jgi:hypothetical protein
MKMLNKWPLRRPNTRRGSKRVGIYIRQYRHHTSFYSLPFVPFNSVTNQVMRKRVWNFQGQLLHPLEMENEFCIINPRSVEDGYV